MSGLLSCLRWREKRKKRSRELVQQRCRVMADIRPFGLECACWEHGQ